MAEDIIDSKGTHKLTVQKSRPLLALCNSELTLQELKMLDLYLSRIDSHKPKNRSVTFQKGEMEKIFGVVKINIQTLKLRLKHMLSTVVEIPDKDDENGFRLITIFTDAEAYRDEKGIWTVRLECSDKAMKYIFNIDSLGYIKYKLQCITRLSSRYSYVMFVYLEDNRFRGEWDVSLDEIRKILGCESELYLQYKMLNKKILTPIYNELKDKCYFEYNPIKSNRSVIGIHIRLGTIRSNSNPHASLDTSVNKLPSPENNEIKEAWMSALKDWNLTGMELKELRELIISIPCDKLPHVPAETGCDDIDLRRFHYIKQKVAEINRRNIKNKFLYIKKIINNEVDNSGI